MSNELMVRRYDFDGEEEEPIKIEFPYPASKFLVKNFSSGLIWVTFQEDASTEDYITIAPGMGQVVVINERGDGAGSPKSGFIMVEAQDVGEVEVQALWY